MPLKDKLLFILSRSRSTINGGWAEFKEAAKHGIALRLLHVLYSLPVAESLPLQRIE